jgi:flagellar motor switch protein FliN
MGMQPRDAAQADYWRNLLKMRLPVSVRLANKRLAVGEILKLQPDQLLTFDRPSDAPAILEVNGQPLGEGEVVRVGPSLGIRLNRFGLATEKPR